MQNRPSILLVEDDRSIREALGENLASFGGFHVLHAETIQEALDKATEYPTLRFIYLDVKIENFKPFSEEEVGDKKGKYAGLRLLREFETLLPKAKIYVKCNALSFSNDLYEYVQARNSVIKVTGSVDWKDVRQMARSVYSGQGIRPEILIVHGHDNLTIQALQNFIRFELNLGEAKILRNLPDLGRTVIEKFEHYARQADLVFAVMTDDDIVGNNRRARQNVIFEIGYFMGAFGRQSRRLIILKKSEIDIPSDMAGILLIDITNGFDAETFGRELGGWWSLNVDL